MDIKQLRETLGLTRAELAEKLGVNRDAIYKYERGMTISKPVQKLLSIISEGGHHH